MNRELLIFQPGLDQSIAVARLYNHVTRAPAVCAAILPGERVRESCSPFQHCCSLRTPEDIRRYHPSTLLATGSISTSILLQQLEAFGPGSVMMTRDALRFFDKPWSLQVARDCGLATPGTWLSPAEVENVPVFVKKRHEGTRYRCRLVRSPESLYRLRAADSGVLYQEYIATPDTFGVAFAAQDGRLLAWHAHRERLSFPRLGGSAALIEEYSDAELLHSVRQLLQAVRYTGWGLAEFKYCPKRKTYVFMELNAKLWASCEFTFRNSPDLCKLILGIEPTLASCRRMIFVNRLLRRSPLTAPFHWLRARDAMLTVYPGLARDVLAGMLAR